MKKYFSVLLILISVSIVTHAQQQPVSYPVSPEMASLWKFQNYPVSLYTGVPNITIPLLSVKLPDYELPVYLSYHSSGARGGEKPTTTGFNWMLSLEPTVSRKINGNADEDGGYLGNPHFRSMDQDILHYITQGTYDEQPDRFSYNLPSGSGTFYFVGSYTTGMKGIPVPLSNVYIDSNFFKGSRRVIDADGTEYYFGLSQDKKYGASEVSYPDFGVSYATNFKASSIITPHSKDTIYFKYGAEIWEEDYRSPASYVVEDFPEVNLVHCTSLKANPDHTEESLGRVDDYYRQLYQREGPMIFKSENRVTTYHFLSQRNEVRESQSPQERLVSYSDAAFRNTKVSVKEVIYPGGRIELGYNNDGLIQSIKQFSTEKLVKRIELYYTNSNITRVELADVNDPAKKQVYNLEYYNGANDYRYSYYAVDSWGFYNGKYTNTELLPPIEVSAYKDTFAFVPPYVTYCVSPVPVSFTVGSADRSIDVEATKTGVLSKIIYPAGGYSEFEYEGNRYSYSQPYFSEEADAGGLRIKRIKNYDPVNKNTLVTRYAYGENENGYGTVRIKPDMGYYKYEYHKIHHTVDYNWGPTGLLDDGSAVESRCQAYSSGLVDYLYENGAPVIYDHVTVYEGDETTELGKTEYEYEIISDLSPALIHNNISNTPLTFEPIYSQPIVNLKKKTVYKGQPNSYNKLLTEEYDYKIEQQNTDIVPGRKVYNTITHVLYGMVPAVSYNDPRVKKGFYIYAYDYTPYRVLKTGQTIKQYDHDSIAVTTVFDYNNLALPETPTSITSYNSNGQKMITNFYYTGETVKGLSNSIDDIMKNRALGLNTKKIKNYLFSKENLTDGIMTTSSRSYPNVNGIEERYQVKNRGMADFEEYLSRTIVKNRVVEEITRQGKSVYIWGYNNTCIVAKLVNTDYSTAMQLLSPNILNTPSNDQALRDELNKLRSISGAIVSTYTYSLGVGITSETDPTGRTIYYEYDGLGRLSVIRDQDKKVIKKICYNYAGQVQDCNN